MDFKKAYEKIAEIDALAEKRKKAILESESDYSKITGKKYYVSNNGNDDNDGLSPEKAWKTIEKVKNTAFEYGDGVLFERGGLWRERLSARSAGVTYSAYGKGAKPKIYGSPENGADASKWSIFYEDESGKKIWKYANEGMEDVGAITFNDGEMYAWKMIPSYCDDKWVVRGTEEGEKIPFDVVTGLDLNLKYVHLTDSVIENGIPNVNSAVGVLYLRCDKGNPGELFDVIEFNTRKNVIGAGAPDITFDNLCVMYGGSHGIGAGTIKGLTVQNCEIGWIGGSVQTYKFRTNTAGKVTRFGNGVEIYGGCENYTIKDCYIYQNYDAAVTHQVGGGTSPLVMNDVLYKGNLIEDCVYSIEYFLGSATEPDIRRDGENILFEDNILRRAGYGFGSTRPDGNAQCHIKSWDSRNEFRNYVVRNNIFDRSVWNLLHVAAKDSAWLPKYEGNVYIQGLDNGLARTGVSGESVVQYAYGENAKELINEKVLGDNTNEIYFTDKIDYYKFPFGE